MIFLYLLIYICWLYCVDYRVIWATVTETPVKLDGNVPPKMDIDALGPVIVIVMLASTRVAFSPVDGTDQEADPAGGADPYASGPRVQLKYPYVGGVNAAAVVPFHEKVTKND